MVTLILIFILACHFSGPTNGLYIDESSLWELLGITDAILNGLGFKDVDSERSQKVDNPLPTFFIPSNIDYEQCFRIGWNRNKKTKQCRDFSHYPEFQKIISNCENAHRETPTCFVACILNEIISREDYGMNFLKGIKSSDYLHYDENEPFPHLTSFDLHAEANIFCATKEYWKSLIKQFSFCKLQTPLDICILGEEKVICDLKLGNCRNDSSLSIIPIGHKAHPLTCAPLNSLNWTYFEDSSKFQCFLPPKSKLLETDRSLFHNCAVCHSKNPNRNKTIIEFKTPPTKEEFAAAIKTSQPIVVRNGANLDLDGGDKINISYIKQLYQDIENTSCEFHALYTKYKNLEHAFLSINDDLQWNDDNSWYFRWSLCRPEIQKKLERYITQRPSYLPDDYPQYRNFWIFAGSPGDGIFYPHIDHFKSPTWQTQLSGNKRWFLRAPPECSKICTKWFQITVNQGDLFLLEGIKWAHGTLVEKGRVSIALGRDLDLTHTGVRV